MDVKQPAKSLMNAWMLRFVCFLLVYLYCQCKLKVWLRSLKISQIPRYEARIRDYCSSHIIVEVVGWGKEITEGLFGQHAKVTRNAIRCLKFEGRLSEGNLNALLDCAAASDHVGFSSC